jgi:hypothetical protein
LGFLIGRGHELLQPGGMIQYWSKAFAIERKVSAPF